MKALLSIKPEFVEKIFNGEKKFEYRKAIFSNHVTTIVVYSTMPVGKVVGEFEVNNILTDTPAQIWEQTKEFSGIKQSFYNEYFEGRARAHAIIIGKATVYEKPRDLIDVIDRKMPPQSFCYI